MPRIRAVRRDELPASQQGIFDDLAATRSVVDGAIQGPFGVMLHSPEAARRTAELGTYYRYESGLPSRVRHLLALIVAQAFDCQYEFTVHAELARADGIPAPIVAAIGRGEDPGPLGSLDELEQTVVRFVRQLVAVHRVEPPTFGALVDLAGMQVVTDIVGNVGYLMMIACPLNAFEVEVRPEQTPELPVG